MTIEYKDSKRIVKLSTDNFATTSLSLTGLKAYYKFDEASGNLINQSTTGDGLGSNADGTASGDPTYSATGKINKAISFDGDGDKFTLGTTAGQWNFLHNNNNFSVSFWLKLNATPSENQGILGTGTGGSSIGFDLTVNHSTGGKLRASIENGAGASANIQSSAGFVPQNTTTWYHYVLTFSNGSWNIYRNGGNNESASSSVSWSTSNHSRNMELANANANTASDVKDLTGELDEVSIWNRVLTSDEISALYSNGGGVAVDDAKSSFISKPTDVQDNSILVEKDTARRYWFTAESERTPTFEDDFSTDNWTDVGTQIGVSGGKMVWNALRSGSNQGSYYDIGTANISETEWVLDFTLDIDAMTEGDTNAYFTIGLSDTSTMNVNTSQDFIGLLTFLSTSSANNSRFMATGANGGTTVGGTDFTTSDPQTLGLFYVRIRRTSATECKVAIYSNSDYSTLVEEQTVTITSGLTGLRYLKLTNLTVSGAGTGVFNGTMDNVKYYNSTTSTTIPATWNRQLPTLPTISGLKLHLDANDSSTITKDGSNLVSAWNDKSGQLNHLSQSTGSKQPLWVDDTLTGLPVIRFDGSNDQLNRSTFVNGAISQGFYMFVVMKPTTGTLYNFDSGSGTRGFCYSHVNAVRYGCGTDVAFDSTIPTTHVMYTFFVNGASSNVRKNSTSINSSNLGSSTLNGLWLASRHTDASFGSPDIAEVILYDNDIGTTNRDAIESYLTKKWGLS